MGNTAIDTAVFAQLKEDLGEDFIVELVDTYCTETPQLIESLRASFSAQDSDVFRRAAHSIKSSSASLGAMRLSEHARTLEMIGKSGDISQAADQLESLAAEYDLASAELMELIHGA